MTAYDAPYSKTRRPTVAEVIAGLEATQDALADALGHQRADHTLPIHGH